MQSNILLSTTARTLQENTSYVNKNDESDIYDYDYTKLTKKQKRRLQLKILDNKLKSQDLIKIIIDEQRV